MKMGLCFELNLLGFWGCMRIKFEERVAFYSKDCHILLVSPSPNQMLGNDCARHVPRSAEVFYRLEEYYFFYLLDPRFPRILLA